MRLHFNMTRRYKSSLEGGREGERGREREGEGGRGREREGEGGRERGERM